MGDLKYSEEKLGDVEGQVKKPPLGLKPRHIHEQWRILEIMAAIERYVREGMMVPRAWMDELNDLMPIQEPGTGGGKP